MPSSSKAFFLSFCNVIFLWFQLPVIFNCCFVLRSSSCGFLFQWVWKLCCPTFSPFSFTFWAGGGRKFWKTFFVKISRHLRQFGTLSFFHLEPNLLGTHYGRWRGGGSKKFWKILSSNFLAISSYLEHFLFFPGRGGVVTRKAVIHFQSSLLMFSTHI